MSKTGKTIKDLNYGVDKSDPRGKGGNDTGYDKGGATGKGSEVDDFLRNQAGDAIGRDADDTSRPTNEALEDEFGRGPGSSGSPSNDGAVHDLLNPDVPTRHGGATGPADYTAGPVDKSDGMTSGPGVANLADGAMGNRGIERAAAINDYDEAGGAAAHDKLAADLDEIDKRNPFETAASGWTDDWFDSTRTPERPPDNFDQSELNDREGMFIDDDAGGLNNLLRAETAAPGTTDGALVHINNDDRSTETETMMGDDGEAFEVHVNRQSTENGVRYGYDEDGEYWAIDDNNNAFPIEEEDIPAGRFVRDLDDSFEGKGNYRKEGDDSTDSQDSGDDTAGDDTTGDDTTGDDTTSDDTTGDDTTGDDTTGDAETDDGDEAEDTGQPDRDYDQETLDQIQRAGDEVEGRAGLDRDGNDDAFRRRNSAGDDVDPVEYDNIEDPGMHRTGNDAGISNPEGTEPVGGGGRVDHGNDNIDYGEDAGIEYDGQQRSPGDDVPAVTNGSGLEGYTPGGPGMTLDPDDLDTGTLELAHAGDSDGTHDPSELDQVVLGETMVVEVAATPVPTTPALQEPEEPEPAFGEPAGAEYDTSGAPDDGYPNDDYNTVPDDFGANIYIEPVVDPVADEMPILVDAVVPGYLDTSELVFVDDGTIDEIPDD